MDKKHFELLLRPTVFCREVVTEIWEGLSTLERIDLLIHLDAIPKELLEKAFYDVNPVVRMFAVKHGYISETHGFELYERIKSDTSPFVRAALVKQGLRLDFEKIKPLSHIEKLGVIALSNSINDEKFSEFIIEGLGNQAISEDEAQALIIEFLRNPDSHRNIERESFDGMDHYTIHKGFESIWNLATCTPSMVHHTIVEEYPLTTGDGGTIPEEMLMRMSDDVLETLVWRDHKSLLALVEKKPKEFGEKVHEAIKASSEYVDTHKKHRSPDDTDISALREEVQYMSEDIKKRFGKAQGQFDLDELFDSEGFLESKVDFIGKFLLVIKKEYEDIFKWLKILAIIYIVWVLVDRFFLQR